MNNKLRFMNSELALLAKDNYEHSDIEKISSFFERHETLKIPIKSNGLYSATSEEGQSVSGYSYTWLRDTVMITNYQVEMSRYDLAKMTMRTIRDYFGRHEHKFINIIEGSFDGSNPMDRPHVRFDGDTLKEIDQQWAHAQNDALGYALWMTFRLCNLNEYQITTLDRRIWALFPYYFKAIEYWRDRDSGHWEETRKIASSSIGVVVAALEEMKKFMLASPSERFAFADKEVSPVMLETLIIKGRFFLDSTLPNESPPDRLADGALLFLIYPLNTVSSCQAQAICESVLNSLKGNYGIKRYLGDSYWCAEYKKLLADGERTVDFSNNIEPRDSMLKPGQEAQWCIFDSIVSVIYGIRYSIGKNIIDLKQQILYFNRCLSLITSNGKCPELYYIEDSNIDQYVANDHVPLAWAQANTGVALKYMLNSINTA